MSLGKMFAGHDEDAEIIRKIKSIKVLDLESCTASVKERFSKKVNRLSLKGYDELMRVNDEGEKVRVLKSYSMMVWQWLRLLRNWKFQTEQSVAGRTGTDGEKPQKKTSATLRKKMRRKMGCRTLKCPTALSTQKRYL